MMKANLVILNGRIIVGKPSSKKFVEAVAIKDGIVVFLGKNEDVRDFIDKNTVVLRLNNNFVIPGLIDSHMHLLSTALTFKFIDLRNVRSIDELLKRVKEKVKSSRPGEWIIGRGWDQDLFKEKRYPTRYELDKISPENPVLLVRICGHVAVVNSLVFKLVDFKKYNEYVERDEEGKPTGIIKEAAIGLVRERIPQVKPDEAETLLLKVIKLATSRGLTTLHTMSFTSYEFRLIQRMYKEDKLKIRVRIYFDESLFKNLKNLGITKGFGNDYIKILGVKLFTDGSFGGRTAALSEEYEDDPGNRGVLLITPKELAKKIAEIINSDLQVAVHAIGDRAIKTVIKAVKIAGVPGNNVRIEHASLISDEILNEIKSLEIKVSVQPHFIISDWWIINRLGKERSRWAYAFKSFIHKGINIGASSDSPVEPLDPLEGIYAAMYRGKKEDIELSKISSNQRLDFFEALDLYTFYNSHLSHEEKRLGTISVGKLADLVVLCGDPLINIKDTKVGMTIIGGEVVYRSNCLNL